MKKLVLALAITLGAVSGMAEGIGDQDVLMTIDGKKIYASEFEYLYTKNNVDNGMRETSYDEYLQLFINFKLKVHAAEALGLDTMQAFVRELAGYRRELAKPYLTDSRVEDEIYREAYSHFSQDCEVSHILFNMPEDAAPADTLATYNRAMRAIARINGGESFAKVADDMSDDRSVTDNHGYLGYFTALQTVWSFEKAMYTLPLNTLSAPIRSNYGYHVIIVHSRRPAWGQVKASHIMKISNEKMSAEEQDKAHKEILDIKARLDAGEDFAKLAKKESDDKNSAARGGDLSWFGINRMVPEFEKAAFALERNAVSEPVRTQFGWHIIRLDDRRSVEPFEKKKHDIHRLMQYDSRATAARDSFAVQLKREYGYRENQEVIDKARQTIALFGETDSLLMAHALDEKGIIASFADRNLSSEQFILYCTTQDRAKKSVEQILKSFIDQQILNYEERHLEEKHADFAHLIQEYHDGILLFSISKQEVWDKGSEDTAGLERYFAANRSKYIWPEPRFKGFVIKCADAKLAKAVRREITKLPYDSAAAIIASRYNTNEKILVQIDRGIWKQGDNAAVDRDQFKQKTEVKGTSELPVVVTVGRKLKKGPETYTDIRGIITADYQNFLERQWIEALRQRHSVVVDQDVFNALKQK